MLGVLASKGAGEAAYAPSIPAAEVPVAGASVAVRAAESLVRAGVDERLVGGATPTVRRLLLDRYPEIGTATERVDATTEHDRVVWIPPTAVVSPAALGAVGSRTATILRRPTEPFSPLNGPEVRPLVVPGDAFAGLDPRHSSDVHPDAELTGSLAVREGATVRSGAVIEGPVLVMPGATVGPNCYVRANSFISGDTKNGTAVELKNSVIMDGASVPQRSYVGDSVVGPRANVGAGSVVANLRHDGNPVTLSHAGQRVRTGRRTFGAAIGEGANLGIGARLNVGTVVGANATTAPGAIVREEGS